MKVIENIVPFNELFYKNCFYNSLFPVVNHFNNSILPLCINEVIVYDNYRQGDFDLIFNKHLARNKMEVVLAQMGIIINSSNYNEDFISNIIKAIDKNKPVILWVDPFYESIRKDTYGKKHDIHTILIYGYDNDKEILNIIEHKHRDTLSYEKCIISYEDISNAYKGYHENNEKRYKSPSYYEFSLNQLQEEGNKTIDYKDIFKTNIKERENELFEGLTKLSSFVDNLKIVFLEQKKLDILVEPIIQSLNNIINEKNVEVYRLSILFGADNNVLRLLQECTDLWILVRAKLVKYNFTKRYRIDTFTELNLALDSILKLELNYLNCMLIL